MTFDIIFGVGRSKITLVALKHWLAFKIQPIELVFILFCTKPYRHDTV